MGIREKWLYFVAWSYRPRERTSLFEKSLDSYKFNLLHCKQTFISQLKSGALGLGENPLENYLDGEISEDVSIYSVYYSDTLESYEGILCEIGGIEVEALISGKTEIVNP